MNKQLRCFFLSAWCLALLAPASSYAQTQRVAAPTFAPPGGTYTGSVTVAIACATPNARIVYCKGTNTGIAATNANFQAYTGPVTLSASSVLMAKASAEGMQDSATAGASYAVVIPRVATPVLSPAPGVYSNLSVAVTIACATPGATVYYTLNGSEPTATSLVYSAAVVLTKTTTLKARAVAPGMLDSATAYGAYTLAPLRVAAPTFAPPGGTYTGSVTVALSCATPNARIVYCKGANSSAATNFQAYTGPVTLPASAVLMARASADGMLDSATVGASYTVIVPRVAAPTFSPSGGTYTGSVTVAIACATPGARIVYSRGANSGTPATNATFEPYTGPVTLSASSVLMAKASAEGMQDSATAGASYTVIVPRVATPVLSPAPGVYSNLSVAVSIACATPGATIYYTLNGSEPTATSLVYSAAVVLTKTTTLKARAVAPGMLDSISVKGAYTLAPLRAAMPTFSPLGGTYTGSVTVAIACATPGARILYCKSANSGTAATNATFEPYTGPVTLSASAVLMAKASADDMLDSATAGASYSVVMPRVATPVLSPAPGVYSNLSVAVTIACATPGATVYYTLNGSEPTATSLVYSAAVVLTKTTTVKAMAVAPGMLNSVSVMGAYTLAPLRAAMPTFSPLGGTYTGSVTVAIACATPGARIVYCKGASTGVSTNAIFEPYTGPVTLSASAVLMAKASAEGMLDSATAGASYAVVVPRVATPTLSPAPGIYSNLSVAVTIACATPGATVYYTLNGSEPTTTSLVYSAAVVLTKTTTVKARAVAPGMLDSVSVAGTYTLAPLRAAAPTFSPPGGTYTGSVTVAIACATPGARIVYCKGANTGVSTNATFEPYTGPVTLPASAVLIAKASADGMLDSAMAGASYTVVVPRVATPTFTPLDGAFSTGMRVTLSCATPDAVICYTLDGREVTASSAVYTVPLILENPVSIHARAYKAGMLDSYSAITSYYWILPTTLRTAGAAVPAN